METAIQEVVFQTVVTKDEVAMLRRDLMPTLGDVERGIGYEVLFAEDEEGFEQLKSFSAEWNRELGAFFLTKINGVPIGDGRPGPWTAGPGAAPPRPRRQTPRAPRRRQAPWAC